MLSVTLGPHEENESMHDPRLYLLLAELLANFVNDIPGTFDGECSSRLERGLPAGEAQGRDRGGEHHPKWEEEVRGCSRAARGPSAPGAQPPVPLAKKSQYMHSKIPRRFNF